MSFPRLLLSVFCVICDERINGKDQRAEKILLSLAPPAEAKIEDTMLKRFCFLLPHLPKQR
jgi:hypothetical protein